jgi:hypothetical protein
VSHDVILLACRVILLPVRSHLPALPALHPLFPSMLYRYMFTGFGAVGCLGIAILLAMRAVPPLASGGGGAGSSVNHRDEDDERERL